MDDATSPFESEIESIVRGIVRRGSLNVTIQLTGGPRVGAATIDVSVLQSYLSAASQAVQQSSWIFPVGDFLALPGVLITERSAKDDEDDSRQLLLNATRECFVAAVNDLQTMRVRDGHSMAQQFRQTFDEFDVLVERIKEGSSRQLAEYESRLEAKVRKSLELLGTKFEAADILREVTLFADRADICEEIVRFSSHVQQMRDLIEGDESPGRKLEFLIQELHREANTIGSKSYDAAIANTVVEIKARIEQLRELVQNVE